MRNLKKILALVLALVMSLSLMAVASADDELNLGDVSDVYAESVDVLTGLKVFMGNKGEFLPKDNITRAEVAAIIYRIVTGDVTNSQNGIYADYNKFSDVTSDAWYAGYVNYCANAEYVKGVGYDANGKAMFKPQQNVTGYEALAMILRAIGYDRNNEFTGPSWQIQTAATARNRGILKNIAEGTLGGTATREAVAEILCQTILVPVADYSLAFGYRTTDANGKDNETLAYKTFKMEKIDGVVMANEYASLTASTPLPAGQTTLGERTLNVTSTLDDIGESRYVYVIPQTGSARYDLVTTKTYDTGLNQVYDNEGAKVSTVNDSTGKDNGITSIAGAQHFINFDEIQEWTATWRLEYVLQVKMSEYDAKTMYYENGSDTNSHLIDLFNDANNGPTVDGKVVTSKIQNTRKNTFTNLDESPVRVVPFPTKAQYENRAGNWKQIVENNTANLNGFTYEYRKVINAGEKLTPTDIANIKAIFTSANYAGGKFIEGEVYAGTNTTNNSITINGANVVISNTADLSDRMNYEQFVENYLKGTDNKRQVTSSGLGQHLKIVDNNNDGTAEYVLQTIYTVAIINANGGLDIAGAEFSHNAPADEVNQVVTTTPVVNDGEGELATGNVVIYALIDGNARAQLAATETVKINTVNRAASTATATGEDGKTWTESSVHTHSPNMKSGVTGMVGNTTYTLYFDLYGNLAAYTEGENGAFVLITDGWFNNTVTGGEYSVRAYIDGSLQTVSITAGGNMFIGNDAATGNTNGWGNLKNFNHLNDDGGSNVKTVIANLDGGIITPVDKMYNYIKNVRIIDMKDNAIPGTAVTQKGTVRYTDYSAGTAYTALGYSVTNTAGNNEDAQVAALSNTVYYYVYKDGTNNTVVRTFTGYANIPTINSDYIEDVYAVGTLASNAVGTPYYTADAVVVELTAAYSSSARRTGEPVFVPDFRELTDNLGFENVRMIRSSNGEVETLRVNMGKSNLDWYDTTGAAVRGSREPGLFYLNEDETAPGTWILNRMNAQQIRGESCILSGFINRSTSTQLNNYATVDLMSPNADPATTATAIVKTDDRGFENRAKLVESSKYYTLAYNSSNIADLKGAEDGVTAAQVLAQNTTRNPNDNGNDKLNEQVNYPTYPTDYNPYQENLNEVLIFTNGNIVAAISFNEYRNFADVTRDYAQTVWANCLSAQNDARNVRFYGVSDRINSTNTNDADTSKPDQDGRNTHITVSYADAVKWNATGNTVVVENSANVKSWTLREVTAGEDNLKLLTNTSPANEQRITPDPNNEQTYILTIEYYTGSSDTYTLVQKIANTTGTLVEKDPDKTTVGTSEILKTTSSVGVTPETMTIDLSKSGKPNGVLTAVTAMTIDEFISLFRVNGTNCSVEWTWTTDGRTTFTTETTVLADGSLSVDKTNFPAGTTMALIKGMQIVVKDEQGNTKVIAKDLNNVIGVLVAKQAAKAAAQATYGDAIAAMAEGAQKTAALAAYNALLAAIDSAANESAVNAIYNGTDFVTSNPTVGAVEDIVIEGKATALPEAVNGVITLTQDVELSAPVVVGEGEAVTVNLNGHNITNNSGLVFRALGGELNITGTGVISRTQESAAAAVIVGSSSATTGTVSKLTVGEGVTIKGSSYAGAYAMGIWSPAGTTCEVNFNGKAEGRNGITVNGNAVGSVTMNIGSTAVINAEYTGLYLAGLAATTVNSNAQITGGETGIEIRAGELNVHGATIRGNGTFAVSPEGDGTTSTGVGIAVAQHTTDKSITVTVDQGTTIAAQKHIYVGRPQGTTGGVLTVNVSNSPAIAATSCVRHSESDTLIVNGTPVDKTEPAPIAG